MLLVEKVVYVFADIKFLDNQSPYFFKKNGLKLRKEIAVEMIPKYAKNK